MQTIHYTATDKPAANIAEGIARAIDKATAAVKARIATGETPAQALASVRRESTLGSASWAKVALAI